MCATRNHTLRSSFSKLSMIRLFGYYVSKIYLYLGIVEAFVFFVSLNLGARVRSG